MASSVTSSVVTATAVSDMQATLLLSPLPMSPRNMSGISNCSVSDNYDPPAIAVVAAAVKDPATAAMMIEEEENDEEEEEKTAAALLSSQDNQDLDLLNDILKKVTSSPFERDEEGNRAAAVIQADLERSSVAIIDDEGEKEVDMQQQTTQLRRGSVGGGGVRRMMEAEAEEEEEEELDYTADDEDNNEMEHAFGGDYLKLHRALYDDDDDSILISPSITINTSINTNTINNSNNNNNNNNIITATIINPNDETMEELESSTSSMMREEEEDKAKEFAISALLQKPSPPSSSPPPLLPPPLLLPNSQDMIIMEGYNNVSNDDTGNTQSSDNNIQKLFENLIFCAEVTTPVCREEIVTSSTTTGINVSVANGVVVEKEEEEEEPVLMETDELVATTITVGENGKNDSISPSQSLTPLPVSPAANITTANVIPNEEFEIENKTAAAKIYDATAETVKTESRRKKMIADGKSVIGKDSKNEKRHRSRSNDDDKRHKHREQKKIHETEEKENDIGQNQQQQQQLPRSLKKISKPLHESKTVVTSQKRQHHKQQQQQQQPPKEIEDEQYSPHAHGKEQDEYIRQMHELYELKQEAALVQKSIELLSKDKLHQKQQQKDTKKEQCKTQSSKGREEGRHMNNHHHHHYNNNNHLSSTHENTKKTSVSSSKAAAVKPKTSPPPPTSLSSSNLTGLNSVGRKDMKESLATVLQAAQPVTGKNNHHEKEKDDKVKKWESQHKRQLPIGKKHISRYQTSGKDLSKLGIRKEENDDDEEEEEEEEEDGTDSEEEVAEEEEKEVANIITPVDIAVKRDDMKKAVVVKGNDSRKKNDDSGDEETNNESDDNMDINVACDDDDETATSSNSESDSETSGCDSDIDHSRKRRKRKRKNHDSSGVSGDSDDNEEDDDDDHKRRQRRKRRCKCNNGRKSEEEEVSSTKNEAANILSSDEEEYQEALYTSLQKGAKPRRQPSREAKDQLSAALNVQSRIQLSLKQFVNETKNMNEENIPVPDENCKLPTNISKGKYKVPEKCIKHTYLEKIMPKTTGFPNITFVKSYNDVEKYYQRNNPNCGSVTIMNEKSSVKLLEKENLTLETPKRESMSYKFDKGKMVTLYDLEQELYQEDKIKPRFNRMFPNGFLLARCRLGQQLKSMSLNKYSLEHDLRFTHNVTNYFDHSDPENNFNDALTYQLCYGAVPSFMSKVAKHFMKRAVNDFMKLKADRRHEAPLFDGQIELMTHMYWDQCFQDLKDWKDDEHRPAGKMILAYLWQEFNQRSDRFTEERKARAKVLKYNLARAARFNEEKKIPALAMFIIRSSYNILINQASRDIQNLWDLLLSKYRVYLSHTDFSYLQVVTALPEAIKAIDNIYRKYVAQSQDYIMDIVTSDDVIRMFGNYVPKSSVEGVKTLQASLDKLMYWSLEVFANHVVNQNVVGSLANNNKITKANILGCRHSYAKILFHYKNDCKLANFSTTFESKLKHTFLALVGSVLMARSDRKRNNIRLDKGGLRELVKWVQDVVTSATISGILYNQTKLDYLERRAASLDKQIGKNDRYTARDWCKIIIDSINSFMDLKCYKLEDFMSWPCTSDRDLDRRKRDDGTDMSFLARERRRYEGLDDDLDNMSHDEDADDPDYQPYAFQREYDDAENKEIKRGKKKTVHDDDDDSDDDDDDEEAEEEDEMEETEIEDNNEDEKDVLRDLDFLQADITPTITSFAKIKKPVKKSSSSDKSSMVKKVVSNTTKSSNMSSKMKKNHEDGQQKIKKRPIEEEEAAAAAHQQQHKKKKMVSFTTDTSVNGVKDANVTVTTSDTEQAGRKRKKNNSLKKASPKHDLDKRKWLKSMQFADKLRYSLYDLQSRANCPFCHSRGNSMKGAKMAIELRKDRIVACCTDCRYYMETESTEKEVEILCQRLEARKDRPIGFICGENDQRIFMVEYTGTNKLVKYPYYDHRRKRNPPKLIKLATGSITTLSSTITNTTNTATITTTTNNNSTLNIKSKEFIDTDDDSD